MPARHIARHLSVLLLAGLWALALVCVPTTTRLSEDRVVTSLGQVETAHSHPAAETPHFGTPENDPNDDGDAVLASTASFGHRSTSEIERPCAARAAALHRHDVARSARGPPTRA